MHLLVTPPKKEYKALPSGIQDEFGKDLRRIQFGESPELKIEHLGSVGAGVGVIELKINGHPAHRCVYVAIVYGYSCGFTFIFKNHKRR